MGKTTLDPNGVKALAALPSLDELRAKIVGLIQAPATKIAQVVTAPAAKVARVVQAYAAKSREGALTSEDDLDTFEGWCRHQAVDPATLAPDQLAMWRGIFDDVKQRSLDTPKVGLMKLQPVPGEHRYAVAVREGSDLWLTLWVRRSRTGEYFVMVPRGDRGWDPHVSYHLNGKFHSKSHGRVGLEKMLQPLTAPFRGTEHLGAHGGHGPKRVGAICDPTAFSGVVELPPGILGRDDGHVVVDLVEPGGVPITWPGTLVREETFKDAEPWLVIRIFRNA